MDQTRRSFLEQVGQGVLLAGVGSQVCGDLGLASSRAAVGPTRLDFGKREPLVDALQTTAPAKLLPLLVEHLKKGTTLEDLVGAAALANARQFGGQDYIGFHTMMALSPALAMSKELPADRKALPVLKVLHRNSRRIAETGGKDVLAPVESVPLPKDEEAVRSATRRKDVKAGEQALTALAKHSAEDALNQVLYAIEDEADVHRVVMAYRSWDMLGLLGKEQAHVMLRQSVRYCIQQERPNRWISHGDCRAVLPKLLEKHGLMDKTRGTKKLDDKALDRLSRDIFSTTPEQAAGLAAEALADGISPETLGEAISLAACELVLRDPGRPKGQTGPGKPEGSIHGDSIGVHACDSVNAWRNLATAANPRNSAACLILAAFHVAQDRAARGGDLLKRDAYPLAAHLEKVKGREAADLLAEAEAGIKNKDQSATAAAVSRYLELKHAGKDAFGLMLRYAISEDGALHAEKFYRTTREEYARTRPAFRGRYLVALARVTASECGQPAPGYTEACKLLGV
jgi:hypothetical protein